MLKKEKAWFMQERANRKAKMELFGTPFMAYAQSHHFYYIAAVGKFSRYLGAFSFASLSYDYLCHVNLIYQIAYAIYEHICYFHEYVHIAVLWLCHSIENIPEVSAAPR